MKKHKCYISAPSDFDLTKIELLLSKLNVDYHNFYDFSIGTTFSDLIARKIRESDFVISILTSENSNVLYELGVAEGMKKPAFILIDKNYKVPFFLERKLFYQTNFTDTKLIELAITNFIADIDAKSPTQRRTKEKKEFLSIEETNDLIRHISHLRKEPREQDFFKLIKDIFSKLNIQNTSLSEAPRDKGADLIIRSKELTPYFGNPILVEVKSGSLSSQRLSETQDRLLEYISKTEAKGGIILYLDKAGKRFNLPIKNPFILCFDLEDFIFGIASDGLEKFLIQRRNEIAHGNRI
jgi:hypothetical protein